MPSRISAVLFDCDGTLVDSEYAHYQAWAYSVGTFGLILSLEEYSEFMGSPAPEIALTFAKKIGKECADILLQTKKAYYKTLIEKGIPSITSTVEFLKRLAKEKEALGFKIGVCSAAKKEDVLTHLRRLDLSTSVDLVLSGQDDLTSYRDPDGVNKPKPYIYLEAMKILNITPEETIVIEDSASGVRAGLSAGCFTIAIPNTYTKTQTFGPVDLYVETFDEMSVADFFEKLEARNLS